MTESLDAKLKGFFENVLTALEAMRVAIVTVKGVALGNELLKTTDDHEKIAMSRFATLHRHLGRSGTPRCGTKTYSTSVMIFLQYK